MNETFKAHVESLHPAFEKLIAMQPVSVCALPKDMPQRGIYLFSEGDCHMYVGRTDRMRSRLQEHCRRSSGHNTAPFAFILARHATGQINASYRVNGSRTELEKDPIFRASFVAAKEQIGRMQVRFVAEYDPMRQALLEMYAAVALQTPHNSFANH
jgi:hypothetical protein